MALVQRIASGLSAFPADVLGPSGRQLEELELSCNEIGNIPAAISRLVCIRVLRIDCNSVSVIPPEIGRLAQLQVLDLHSNLITSLPIQLAECRKLELLNLLDNPLTGPAPPDGERNFSMLYYGTAQQPDINPETSDDFVRTATSRTLSFLGQYLDDPEPVQPQAESQPASSPAVVQGKVHSAKSSSKAPVGGVMRKSDAIARLSRAMAAADPAKLRSAVAAAQAAGVTGSQVDTAAAAADCLDELAAATQSGDATRLRNAISAWEHLLLPAKPHGQAYLAARSACAILAKKDTKPWRQALSPQEVEAKRKQRAHEEEVKAHLDDRLLERQQAGESSFQAWLAHKAELKAREQQALHGFLRWQAEARQYSSDIAYYEQQRLVERERAWPSRIVVPPSTPSFNVKVRAAHSVMASRVQSAQPSPPSSPVAAAQRSPQPMVSPATYRRSPPSLAVVVPMRPSTSPQRSPWRASSASQGSVNGRAQSAGLQTQRADMLKAGLPASGAIMVFNQHVSNANQSASGRSPRARALHARLVAKQAWSGEKIEAHSADASQLHEVADNRDVMNIDGVAATNDEGIATVQEETNEEALLEHDTANNVHEEASSAAERDAQGAEQGQVDEEEVRSEMKDEQVKEGHEQAGEAIASDVDDDDQGQQQPQQDLHDVSDADVGDQEDAASEHEQQFEDEQAVAKQDIDSEGEHAVDEQYEDEVRQNDEVDSEVEADTEYKAEDAAAENANAVDEQGSEYSEQPERDEDIANDDAHACKDETEEDVLAEIADCKEEVSETEMAEKDQQVSKADNHPSEVADEPADHADHPGVDEQQARDDEEANEDDDEDQTDQSVHALPAEDEEVVRTQDDEVPLPPHYAPAPPPGERPKAPRRHDIADRPQTSHNTVRQASLDRRAPPPPNFGNLGPVTEKSLEANNMEDEEAVESADNRDEQENATPERSAVMSQESEDEPDTMFIECGKNHGARVESAGPVLVALGAHVSAALPVMDAPKVAPGAVLATEELLAMKSIRILGSPASSDDEADDLLAVAQDELPASKLPQTAVAYKSDSDNNDKKDFQQEDAASGQAGCSDEEEDAVMSASQAEAVEGDDPEHQMQDDKEQQHLSDNEKEQLQNDEDAQIADQQSKHSSVDCQQDDVEQLGSAEDNAIDSQDMGKQAQQGEDFPMTDQEDHRESYPDGSPAQDPCGPNDEQQEVKEEHACDEPISDDTESAVVEGIRQQDSEAATDRSNAEEHGTATAPTQSHEEQDDELVEPELHPVDNERQEICDENVKAGIEEEQQQVYEGSVNADEGVVESSSTDAPEEDDTAHADEFNNISALQEPVVEAQEQMSDAEQQEDTHEEEQAVGGTGAAAEPVNTDVQNTGTYQVLDAETEQEQQTKQQDEAADTADMDAISASAAPATGDDDANVDIANTDDDQHSDMAAQGAQDINHAQQQQADDDRMEGEVSADNCCEETAAMIEPGHDVEAATEDVDGAASPDNDKLSEEGSLDADAVQGGTADDDADNEQQESLQQTEEASADADEPLVADEEVSGHADMNERPDGHDVERALSHSSENVMAVENISNNDTGETGQVVTDVPSMMESPAVEDSVEGGGSVEEAAIQDDAEASRLLEESGDVENADCAQPPEISSKPTENKGECTDDEETAADSNNHDQTGGSEDEQDITSNDGSSSDVVATESE